MSGRQVKTSLNWCRIFKIYPGDILDPDGWDRSSEDNFHYDFNQKVITKSHFDNKICASTCQGTAFEYCKNLTNEEG